MIPAHVYGAQETKKCNSEKLTWQRAILKGQFLELFLISLLCFSDSKLANSNLRSYYFIYHVKIDMHLKSTHSSTISEKILIYISILSYRVQILFDWYCIEQGDFSRYISLAYIYPTLWTDSFVVVGLNLVQIAMKTRYFLSQESQIFPHLPPVESH